MTDGWTDDPEKKYVSHLKGETLKVKFGTKKTNTNQLNPFYKSLKRWDEVIRKVVLDDQGERMGRVVPKKMSWYEMAVQELD